MGLRSIIKEALRKTKDKEFVSSYLKKMGLKKDEFYFYEKDGYGPVLIIEVTLSNKDLLPNVVKTIETYFGWFLSALKDTIYGIGGGEMDSDTETIKKELPSILDTIYDEYGEEMNGVIELIFDPLNWEEDNSVKDFAYHITDKSFLPRIKKQGLVPRSKSKMTYHPERIYLLKDPSDMEMLIKHGSFSIDDPILLKIDMSGFSGKLQKDVALDGGVFTVDNISPDRIVDVTSL